MADDNEKPDGFQCPGCRKYLATTQGLNEHKRTNHLTGVCYFPGSTFPDFEGEDDHRMAKQLLEANDKNGGSESGDLYVCRWGCAAGAHTYKSLAALKFHLRAKQRERVDEEAKRRREAEAQGAEGGAKDADSKAAADPGAEAVPEAGSSAQDDAGSKDGAESKSDAVGSKDDATGSKEDTSSKGGADSKDDAASPTTSTKDNEKPEAKV
ncbi:hypothetical protein F4820DRAFT_463986 [Hypoxylon rubiginosum]|uniref:Uncharacterized protein n=1 Tax=Hypoxylon rubiginosum TaxID=110542 RepID=A0ACB9YT15_9PEZI|nr:hypothetical protein F4820DRAFT_463986 [Hypoxylon rubiginosum]